MTIVDDLPELLHVGPGHAPPQVSARTTDGGADDGRGNDGRREEDADQCTGRGAAPRSVASRHLVLVDVDLAGVVLGHHRAVIGPDRAGRVKCLDDLVVGVCRPFARVRADEYEDPSTLAMSHSLIACPPPGCVEGCVEVLQSW